MRRIFADLETRSRRDIRYGTYAYAEDCEVLLWAYALDDDPVRVWDLTAQAEMPADLRWALDHPGEVRWVWHNGANFDCVVLARARNVHADIPADIVDDTLVIAYSHGLPGALGSLCDVYGLAEDQAKEKDGRRLVLKFCKPTREGTWRDSSTDPEDWKRFVHYAGRDVEAMRLLFGKLPKWNWRAYDQALFAVDRRINARGMLIDMDLARACVALAERTKAKNDARTRELTDGAVSEATQRDEMLRHICAVYGVTLPDLTTATVERRLADPDLPQALKDLLLVRLASSKASVSKYKMLLSAVSFDNRLRGGLQFRGAARTGRYAGRLFQPQNLPRPTLEQHMIDAGIEAIKAGSSDLDLIADETELMRSCLRGYIVAPEGEHLVVADLSNIEGRMLSWLAGEEWKLAAFRAADAGKGHYIYKLTYGRTFGVDPSAVTKKQRQIGKVEELALGYRGGVGAFLTFATAYRVNLDELAEHVKSALPADVYEKADGMWDWYLEKKLTRGLKRPTFVALEAIKSGWRAAHPAITRFWTALEDAVRMAMNGVPTRVGHVVIDRKGSWLRMRLPSGRYICYPGAQLEDGGAGVGVFSYMGVSQYTKKWERIHTHGGKISENLTQAAAYDVLAEAMPRIEDAGFRIVLSVHDEFITEADMDRTSKDLAALMAAPPAWAPDLPLAAAGFEAPRYRKD